MTQFASKPRFPSYYDINNQHPGSMPEVTRYPKHHTQHDIINNTALWAPVTLIMLHTREREF